MLLYASLEASQPRVVNNLELSWNLIYIWTIIWIMAIVTPEIKWIEISYSLVRPTWSHIRVIQYSKSGKETWKLRSNFMKEKVKNVGSLYFLPLLLNWNEYRFSCAHNSIGFVSLCWLCTKSKYIFSLGTALLGMFYNIAGKMHFLLCLAVSMCFTDVVAKQFSLDFSFFWATSIKIYLFYCLSKKYVLAGIKLFLFMKLQRF